jgi:mxaJ protein
MLGFARRWMARSRSSPRWPCFLVSVACSLLIPFAALPAYAADSPSGVLRVCADPNGMPFSNRQEAGFENALARLVAGALGYRLEYFWWAQRRGYVRNTLGAGKCDVVIGVTAGAERLLTTRPYYRSSYVFLQRRGTPPITSLDDPALRSSKIGVQLIGDDFANAPPAHSLGRRGIVDNVVGFMVYGDYASADPERPIIDAVGSGAIDLAIVWGPLAGYYALSSSVPLELRPVAPLSDGIIRMSFAIAMGVRKSDSALRDQLDRVLERERRAVSAILARYGVPVLASPEPAREGDRTP